jgi:hypothetical protein
MGRLGVDQRVKVGTSLRYQAVVDGKVRIELAGEVPEEAAWRCVQLACATVLVDEHGTQVGHGIRFHVAQTSS